MKSNLLSLFFFFEIEQYSLLVVPFIRLESRVWNDRRTFLHFFPQESFECRSDGINCVPIFPRPLGMFRSSWKILFIIPRKRGSFPSFRILRKRFSSNVSSFEFDQIRYSTASNNLEISLFFSSSSFSSSTASKIVEF